MQYKFVLCSLIAGLSVSCSNQAPQQEPAAVEETTKTEAIYHSPFDAEATKQLDEFIESARQLLGVPGIAVGVVDHGEVVYKQGFGTTGIDNGIPITTQTLFSLCDISKAVSGYALAKVAQDGDLRWDEPLSQMLNNFEASTPELTQRLTVADALCDCSGLPGNPLASFFTFGSDNYTKALARIKTMPFVKNIGKHPISGRNNALFSLGCYATALRIYPDLPPQDAFRNLVQKRVLTPLGMTSTTYRPDLRNTAMPHGSDIHGNVRLIDCPKDQDFATLEPAFGLWSNVDDMLKLIQAEIDSQEPQNLERRKERAQRDGLHSAGIAMRMQIRRDVVMYGFRDAQNGYENSLIFIPDRKLGAIVLANARLSRLYLDLIVAKILDIAMNQSAAPWLLEEMTRRLQAANDSTEPLIGKTWIIEPDHAWYKQFLGTYHDDVLGWIEITDEGNAIYINVGEWRSRLGVRIDNTGNKSMLLLDPPLAGFSLTPTFENKRLKAIELIEPHRIYRFVKQTRPKKP